MSRRISGASSNPPFQVNRTQSSDTPVTSPPAEQSSASQASGSSSIQTRKGKRREAQLRAKMQEANKAETQKWEGRLMEDACLTLLPLCINSGENLEQITMEDSRWKGKLDNTEDEQTHEQCLEEGKPIIEQLEKAKSDYEKEFANISAKAISAIEGFDSLPSATKSRLYTDGLKDIVSDAKTAYMNCIQMELSASVFLVKARDFRAEGKCVLLDSKYAALIQKMSDENQHSDEIQSAFEELSADYSQLSQYSKAYVEDGIKTIEACDKALAHPYSDKGTSNATQNILNRTRGIVSHLHLIAMESAHRKFHMSMEFAVLGNGGKQGTENLRKWHELTNSLMEEEYHRMVGVSHHLIIKSERLDMQQQSANQLARDELLVKQEASRDVQNNLEKILRGCKKRLEEYDNLEDGVKDNGVRSTLQELTEAATEFLRSREHAVQFWTDKLKELDDRNASFLPSHMRSKPSRQHTDKKTSSLPPSVRPEPSQKDDFHVTTEGMVLGRINDERQLESLDNKGKVITTYFQDEDSGKWVKDYGDAPDSEQSALFTTSTASDSKTAVREKAEWLAQKAGNIAQASIRFSEKSLAEVVASSGYDDKINLLQRAVSNKAKAVAKIKNLLFDLDELQLKDQPGKKLSATLKDHLKHLQAEKKGLYEQLQQTQQALNHHSHKRRDPNGGNFKFLWEHGQVTSIVNEFTREPSHNNANDLLDRYVISFSKGAQGEDYEPWIVHAHYDSKAPNAAPVRVHMKRNAEKDWGMEQQAYHSLPLSKDTFNLVKKEAQKPEAPSVKKGNRKKR